MKTLLKPLMLSLFILVVLLGAMTFWTTMPGLIRMLLIIVGVITSVYGAITIWAMIPSRKFEPLAYKPIRPDYWPTKGFRVSPPESQGMDSAKLVEIVDYCNVAQAKNPGVAVDSITLIRNGYLVADFYLNPLFPRDTAHVIHSCTKSIMSALIGIAIEQGFIESVDTPIVAFFKEKEPAITDEKMARVTLKDLLTMQTGMRSRDSYLYQWEGIFAMQASADWVAHILGLPMDTEPGTRFDYSNLSSFLLSAIIQAATGIDTLDFARKNLFGPLGIEEVRWEWSPKGIGIGYARMWLKPQDMAKFGLLFLQQGQWDSRQIVPAAWIKASITPHAYPKNYVEVLNANGQKDQAVTSRNWVAANFFRAFADGYGYQWWLDKSGSYSAVGVAGQYIMVVPRQNLVMVVTSSASGAGVFFPKKVLDKFVLPAVIANDPLPANPAAQQELAEKSGPPILDQMPQPVPPLPPTAEKISGRTYKLEANAWHYDDFKFEFDPMLDQAEFSYTVKGQDTAVFAVGLDGVYRFTDTEIGRLAAVGSWTTLDTFELICHQIGYTAPTKFIVSFKPDGIDVTEVSQTGTHTYSGKLRPIHAGALATDTAGAGERSAP